MIDPTDPFDAPTMISTSGTATTYTRKKTNHLLHLILTIFTCGAWAFVWPLVWAWNTFGPKTATQTHYYQPPQPYVPANPVRMSDLSLDEQRRLMAEMEDFHRRNYGPESPAAQSLLGSHLPLTPAEYAVRERVMRERHLRTASGMEWAKGE
jgi:hypothetical protein